LVIQEKESSNEELRAANEEIQSTNEELQSTNEELETAKEELQSTNEELTTVNEEIQNRNLELAQLNDDMSNLLTSVNLPIVILGSDLRIRRANPQAEKLLNLLPTDVGRSIADLRLNIDSPDLTAHIIEVMDKVTPKELDIKDNQGHWWTKWIRPYRTSENKIEGVVLTFINVDRLKRAEEKLRSESETLEKLVAEKTSELANAARLSAIGETAAMVGHDLRNPLQVIANTLHLAMEQAKIDHETTLLPLLDTIQEQAEYANRIVTDVQDYARPVSPRFAQVKLAKLFEETLSSLELPKTVKLSTEVEEAVSIIEGDSSLLRRALANIVTNALQAMPRGGRLTIRASRLDNTAIIKVTDSGEGINPETIKKVFNPLFTTRAKGIGLGLPIAKRLVEAHEGKIDVVSDHEKGTIVSIELPLVQSKKV